MASVCTTPTERSRKFFGVDVSCMQDGETLLTFNSWCWMIQRCLVPGSLGYAHYTGRGIQVCERWFLFSNFVADMGMRKAGQSIDRINNGGDYEPGNCHWATPLQQGRNTSRNVKVGDGLQVDAARKAGVSDATIMRRLKSGYSHDEAVKNELIKKIKLCKEDATEIKRLLALGVERKHILKRFGVSHSTVGHIARGVTWKAA